jgi:hypothetical protein
MQELQELLLTKHVHIFELAPKATEFISKMIMILFDFGTNDGVAFDSSFRSVLDVMFIGMKECIVRQLECITHREREV